MINFIIWIIVGGFIGWLASIIMKTNSRQGLITDIIVGIVGAFVGGYFLSPLFNVSTINESNYSIPALLVSLGGAIILLAISKLFRNIGGFLLIVGLLTRPAAFAIMINMLVAVLVTLPNGFLVGASYPFSMMVSSIIILLAGPMAYSLDACLLSGRKKGKGTIIG